MPNRIIKEGLLTSESYHSLSLFERDLFIRLIVAADDYGRYDARPAIIRGRLMPLETVEMEAISQGLEALAEKGMIEIYEREGQPYLHLCSWERHQNIRAKRSKYPEPPREEADSIGTQMLSDAPVIQSVSESKKESVSQSELAGGVQPPTAADIARYCFEKRLSVDAESFWAYNQARGWRIGTTPIQDWKSLLRTWKPLVPAGGGEVKGG